MKESSEYSKHLAVFQDIANGCTEEECLDLIEDCALSIDPFVNGPVRDVYQKRLDTLKRQEQVIEYYEDIYD